MSAVTIKKIKMKIFEVPLPNDEFIDYALKRDIKIAKIPKNTFLLGEVSVDNEIYGLLGLEKEYWADEKSVANADLIDQITIKLFDKAGKNTGIIEERILKELSQSVSGAKLPVFSITHKGSPYLIDIEKEANKSLFPLLINKAKGAFEIFEIIKKTIAIGADFEVHRKLGDNKVAFIDSKHGGTIEIHIYDIELAKNPLFIDVLALFAGTIKFHNAMGIKIDKVMKELVAGTIVLHPSKKTLELMLDPRHAPQVEKPEKLEKPAKKGGLVKKKDEELHKKRMIRRLRGVDEEEEEETKAKSRKKPGKKRAFAKDEVDEELVRTAKKRGRKRMIAKDEEEELGLKRAKSKISAKEEEEVASLKKPQKIRPLYPEDPVREMTGITEAISELLEDVGVMTIDDLLSADPEELADEIGVDSITSQKIKQWQKACLQRVKAALKEEEEIEPEREEEPDEDSDKYDMLDMDL